MPSVNRFSLAETDEDLVVSPATILLTEGSGTVIADFPEAVEWSADVPDDPEGTACPATPGSFDDAAPAIYEDTASGSEAWKQDQQSYGGSTATPSDMEE